MLLMKNEKQLLLIIETPGSAKVRDHEFTLQTDCSAGAEVASESGRSTWGGT